MTLKQRFFCVVAVAILPAFFGYAFGNIEPRSDATVRSLVRAISSESALFHDESPPLATLAAVQAVRIDERDIGASAHDSRLTAHDPRLQPTAASVEQTKEGTKPAPELVASFDGLGNGFKGPQGVTMVGNPSDNSLAVGPDHIVQTVNTKMAIFTKKGLCFGETGRVLYGPVDTGNVFKDFGDFGSLNGGDAVVVYDQLADRWLVVIPIFRKLPFKENAKAGKGGGPVQLSLPGVPGQPGAPRFLYQPAAGEGGGMKSGGGGGKGGGGSYAMCYAISTTSDPLGSYYRYIFERPLFPDYPRPAVWPDGYYNPTSTGDKPINPGAGIYTQRHAYVVDRQKMLKGEAATEQGFIIENVVFLLNADIDGKQVPPPGAPNIMMTAGGMQLQKILKDDGIYWWKFYVDWKDPSKTKLEGPTKIPVAPYEYLGGGQLTAAAPQQGTTQKLDVQGDKLINRLVYRRIGDRESLVGSQSIKTAAGGGGVRWYEFRLDKDRNVQLHQQGTFAPDANWRWMAGTTMDAKGNIGIAYSFSGPTSFPGQRFTGRLADDPSGTMTMREGILVEGEGPQAKGVRWQDYTAAVMDPSDDMTIWYVGDYYKKGATSYSTRIGGFRLTGK